MTFVIAVAFPELGRRIISLRPRLSTPIAKFSNGPDPDRTGNLRDANPALSQLSYRPQDTSFYPPTRRFQITPLQPANTASSSFTAVLENGRAGAGTAVTFVGAFTEYGFDIRDRSGIATYTVVCTPSFVI